MGTGPEAEARYQAGYRMAMPEAGPTGSSTGGGRTWGPSRMGSCWTAKTSDDSSSSCTRTTMMGTSGRRGFTQWLTALLRQASPREKAKARRLTARTRARTYALSARSL